MKQDIRLSRREMGFSLMEVIVTMAIIGIMVAIAIPSVLLWRQNTQYVGTVQGLSADIQRAKLRAIKDNTQCYVTLAANSYAVFLETDGTAGQSAGDLEVSNVQLPAGFVMTTSSSPAPLLFNFTGTGRTNIASEEVIQIDAPNGRRGFVRVNMLGRIGQSI